jgi:hypothetical protein
MPLHALTPGEKLPDDIDTAAFLLGLLTMKKHIAAMASVNTFTIREHTCVH